MNLTPVTALDAHGPDWRAWVLENLQRGCAPVDMLDRMVKGGWQQAQAAAGLDEGLTLLNQPNPWRPRLPTIGSAENLQVGTQTVRVLARFAQPRAALLDNVLSTEECAQLIDHACDKGLKKSGVVDGSTGVSITHDARTSTSVFLKRAETPLIDVIEQRLAQLTDWPLTHGEGLQILRYEPGQQYKPHFDWFDPKTAGGASHLQRGGQRVATTVLYLATADAGGATSFPKTGIEVSPRAGGAIFFTDVDAQGMPDPLSLHAGTPVVAGAKIVMTYWQREGPFV